MQYIIEMYSECVQASSPLDIEYYLFLVLFLDSLGECVRALCACTQHIESQQTKSHSDSFNVLFSLSNSIWSWICVRFVCFTAESNTKQREDLYLEIVRWLSEKTAPNETNERRSRHLDNCSFHGKKLVILQSNLFVYCLLVDVSRLKHFLV